MISGTTRLLGVIGDPVSHSRSPRMQNAALKQMGLDWTYVPLHVTADQLESRVGVKIARGAPALWEWVRMQTSAFFSK